MDVLHPLPALAYAHACASCSAARPCAHPPAHPAQVLPTLASLLLLAFSGAARVRALYQRSVTTSDQLYYPLIVAPELLQQLLISVPTLLHRSGLAESYTGWRCKIWAWVACAFPTRPPTPDAEAAGAAPGKAGSECAESHGSKVSGECGGVPNEPGEL